MKTISPALLILLALAALLAACGPTRSTAADVAKAAGQIADFDLPADYKPELTVHMLGYTLAGYNPGDGHSHLYLIQSENEADGEKLMDMLAQITAGQSDRKGRMSVTEKTELTVRGEPAVRVDSEGTSSVGGAYRQTTVAFRGKGGPALLMVSAPSASFDPETVEALIASLR